MCCGSRRSVPKSAATCAWTAFLAVAVATVFMGIYIAVQFRGVSWSFGAGAVIALIHDVLVVTGALVLSRLEFDLTTLAAVLTVIGYSVHDTIIVSDRIREDAAKRRREPLESIMNRAINETLSRTILTSGTASDRAAVAARCSVGRFCGRRRLRSSSESSPEPIHRFISPGPWCFSGKAAAARRAPPLARPDSPVTARGGRALAASTHN